ncbi:MAG TPA: AAA family ATPase, partial [Solirubrobacteraceae bacterium]|nr:AAA family ATPase [Solirubrobacteraceae bacterium]
MSPAQAESIDGRDLSAKIRAELPPHGTPSHAYLFHGPPGAGKRTAARSLAAALLAEGAPDPDGVAARVARDSHPDLTWVRPRGAAEMLVGDVLEALAAGSHTPFEATRRVLVIEDAHLMNDQAANRLLKTLEDPPSFVHLILLAHRPRDLLATVASRCRPL